MLTNILGMGAFGCLLFTLFLIFMSYSGIAAAMRDEEGNFRKEKSFKSILGAVLFFSFLIGLLYSANMRFADGLTDEPGLMDLWLNSFGVFFVLHVFDLIVLDYLVVVKWHPEFLKLPNTDYYRTFRPHVIGFFKGIPLGIIASLIVSLIFLWTR